MRRSKTSKNRRVKRRGTSEPQLPSSAVFHRSYTTPSPFSGESCGMFSIPPRIEVVQTPPANHVGVRPAVLTPPWEARPPPLRWWDVVTKLSVAVPWLSAAAGKFSPSSRRSSFVFPRFRAIFRRMGKGLPEAGPLILQVFSRENEESRHFFPTRDLPGRDFRLPVKVFSPFGPSFGPVAVGLTKTPAGRFGGRRIARLAMPKLSEAKAATTRTRYPGRVPVAPCKGDSTVEHGVRRRRTPAKTARN